MIANKFILLILILILAQESVLQAQFAIAEENSNAFFFDAVCFKNDSVSNPLNNDSIYYSGRIDVYTLIPYQTLSFEQKKDIFISTYNLTIDIYDTTGQKVVHKTINGKVLEKEYFVTQGGTAKFENIFWNCFVNPGKYSIQITIVDLLSRNSYKKSRDITVIGFNKYKLSISGIMLISSMEERNGKFIITPHISDNVAALEKGFFVFFEVYNRDEYEIIDFAYEIINSMGKVIFHSEKYSGNVNIETSRHYKKVKLPDDMEHGSFTIRLFALKPNGTDIYSDTDYLAITERSFRFNRSLHGLIVDDIDLAVRYLRYVANQSDIDFIESSPNNYEKQKRFLEYWKNIDPSPNTERNEAFDEYYGRIEYANNNYKSYTEGWLSDMGMVYIIYGQPSYVQESNYYNGKSRYIKWSYLNNKEFLFIDDSGLGDYRLSRSYPVGDKYKYSH